METTDKQFFLTFFGVTAALVGIAIVILIAANWVGKATDNDDRVSQAQVEIIRERIAPVGELRMQGDSTGTAPVQADAAPEQPPQDTAEQDTAEASQPKSGKEVYSGICQSCHASGVAGAPILGDSDAWASRLEQGMDVLHGSVLNGKGAMPPKGGDPSLSEAEIQSAVDYMVEAVR